MGDEQGSSIGKTGSETGKSGRCDDAPPYARAFDPRRLNIVAAGPTELKENADVAKHLLGDRLRPATDLKELGRGEGGIVLKDVERVAAYRDSRGEVHLLDTTCTHLGCELAFNVAEASWDRPCHGSRYDAVTGAVLEGPAVSDLKVIDSR